MANSPIYKVVFVNLGQSFEIYAKNVNQSDMYGFIEVEELIFGSRTQVVVDPSEEKLKAEFEGVKRSYIPMHSIVRIDEVEKLGVAKISDGKNNGVVTDFPMFQNKPLKPD